MTPTSNALNALNVKVAIVGAGPAGLVLAKTLQQNNFSVTIFEQESNLGGTFRYRSYENAELVSSRQLTAFSDFRIQSKSKDHVTLQEYVEYLESYARHFEIYDKIQFNTRVDQITPKLVSGYTVTVTSFNNTSSHQFFAVGVCSGLHVTPNIPNIPGIEHIPEAIHSSSYKSPQQLVNKDVLILGLGETSMDISYHAIQHAKSVTVSHKHGTLSFPKRFNDFSIFGRRFDAEVPIDTLISNLFENAYVSPLAKQLRLRWHVSDIFVRQLLHLLTGSSIGANQFFAPAQRIGRAYNFLNKSTNAVPYLNANPGFRKPYWWSRFFKLIEPDTQGKVIHLRPWPSHVNPDGTVSFMKNSSPESRLAETSPPCKPNLVIYATGYTQDFSFLDSLLPKPSELDVRDILASREPHLAFIGFVRPNVGAIPPIAEMQAMWWCRVLQEKLNPSLLIEPKPHWHLLAPSTKRIQYGIDHSSYVYQLAKDIGATPSLFPPSPIFYKNPKLALIYSMCASFNTCFRLVGPFAFPEAADIVSSELWETVTRRGLYGNVIMGMIPMMFYGIVNLWLFLFESMIGLFGVKLHTLPN